MRTRTVEIAKLWKLDWALRGWRSP